ncbi:MAG: hypothetical protein IJD82_08190 [Clostridia bacterium]|nr:hypothetical protein [Clostridia bacterium]
MQKKIFAKAVLFALLAALLLTVGCAEEQESSVTSSDDASSAESAVSSQTVISLPEDSSLCEESSLETSSEAIELPGAPEFVLQGGVRFCPDAGWEATDEHVYTSPDGMQSVRAEVLTLPDPKGITESLLVDDAVQTLPDALAQTGAEIVTLESAVVDFLGTQHPSVSLVTTKNGKTVYQQQFYLLDGESVLLLTLSTQTEDRRETLLAYFQQS